MDTQNYADFLARASRNRSEVMRLRGEKYTMEQIAALVGISRQRVGQIVRKEQKRATGMLGA